MTMRVTMREPKRSEDGLTVLQKGSTYTVSDEFGAQLVQQGAATDTDGSIRPVNDQPTVAEVLALRALLEGGGVDVSFTRAHDGQALGYTLDAGSGNVLPVMRVAVESPTDVIAGQRITAGGTNSFQTTITGASTTGEVIPISVGSGVITRVHVGSSAGVSQAVDNDGAVTVNEIASWSCLEVDDCNVVYVRFAPPRGSGRYCDVSIVGKARSS